MKFIIAMFLPASLFIQTSCLLTLKIFANLPVYCTVPDYCLGRNMPVSPFIPPSPSIWNSRVTEMYRFVKVKWIVGYSFDKSVWSVIFFCLLAEVYLVPWKPLWWSLLWKQLTALIAVIHFYKGFHRGCITMHHRKLSLNLWNDSTYWGLWGL